MNYSKAELKYFESEDALHEHMRAYVFYMGLSEHIRDEDLTSLRNHNRNGGLRDFMIAVNELAALRNEMFGTFPDRLKSVA